MGMGDHDALNERGSALDAERASLVIAAAAEGMYDWDVLADSLWVSDRLDDMFGFDAGHLDAARWVASIHPDDAQRYRTSIRHQFQGGDERFELEYRIENSAGELRWVSDRARIVRDGGLPPAASESSCQASPYRGASCWDGCAVPTVSGARSA